MQPGRRFFGRRRVTQHKPLLALHTDLVLLRLSGRDCTRLLQSLTTSDVQSFLGDRQQFAQSSLFLNATGRIVSPVMLLKPSHLGDKGIEPIPDEVLLQVHRRLWPQLQEHIQNYSFEQDFKTEEVTTEYDQFTVFVS